MEDLKNKRILIIGGTGFIGRHIATRALQSDLNVTCISLKDEPQARDYEIITCDICDKEKLFSKLKNKKFEYVINCGGYIDHSLFDVGGRKLIDQHFTGTLNLVEILDRQYLKAFVQLGSSDEYGSNEVPQSEQQRERPISPYSLGKTATTHFLQMLHRQDGFPSVIFRLFLVYGPGQSLNRFVPHTINSCLKNIKFPVSKGEQLRDFCYIDNITDAILASLHNPSLLGEVINLASGQPVSIKTMINKIQELAGGGAPEFGKIDYRPGENMSLYANMEKARKLMDWSPSVTLEDGLNRTIEFYRNQI